MVHLIRLADDVSSTVTSGKGEADGTATDVGVSLTVEEVGFAGSRQLVTLAGWKLVRLISNSEGFYTPIGDGVPGTCQRRSSAP